MKVLVRLTNVVGSFLKLLTILREIGNLRLNRVIVYFSASASIILVVA